MKALEQIAELNEEIKRKQEAIGYLRAQARNEWDFKKQVVTLSNPEIASILYIFNYYFTAVHSYGWIKKEEDDLLKRLTKLLLTPRP